MPIHKENPSEPKLGGVFCWPIEGLWRQALAAAGGGTAGVALQAGAIAQHGHVAAVGAGFALIAFGLGNGASIKACVASAAAIRGAVAATWCAGLNAGAAGGHIA